MSPCADQDYLPCSPYVSTENLLCECSGVDFSDPANVELGFTNEELSLLFNREVK